MIKAPLTRIQLEIAGLSIALFLLFACIPTQGPQTTPPGQAPPIGPSSCTIGQEWCQGSCVDSISFVNDNANCGRCGNCCSYSETCTGGFCQCSPSYEMCQGSCTSTSSFISDSSNCGRCGSICFGGQSCVGGMCQKL